MTIRVVLADDHEIFLQGLSSLLQSPEINVIASTRNRDELLEIIVQEQPDVAVVDFSMPGINIPQLLAILREQKIPTAVAVLTGSDKPGLAQELLTAGTRGFLLKEYAFESLLEAIQTIVAGNSFVSPQAACDLLALQSNHTPKPSLTRRQLEILRMVAEGDTSKHIASKLGLHVKTVDNHRHAIREKLGVHSSAEMVRVAKELQLI
jgi:DNA-binding NarL/FixJ family response regulator